MANIFYFGLQIKRNCPIHSRTRTKRTFVVTAEARPIIVFSESSARQTSRDGDDRTDDGNARSFDGDESESPSSDEQRTTEPAETSVFDRIPRSTIEAITGIVASIASIRGVKRQRSNRS